jgi:alpha-glucosidase (family GH31 glycosyl hydrolase)
LLDYPDDHQVWRIEDQYSFGRDLLIAPVVDEGVTGRQVYLPEGSWYDFWSGDAYTGGQRIDVTVPLDRIPVYARGGAVVPLHLGETGALGDDVGNHVTTKQPITFKIFSENDCEWSWIDSDGREHVFTLTQAVGHGVTVVVPPLAVHAVFVLRDGRKRRVEPSDVPQEVVFI